jgi:ParB family chromosome partitioning protein
MAKEHIKIRPPSPEMLKMGTPSLGSRGRTSNRTEGLVTEIYHIRVDKLIPFKGQSRKLFDEDSILGLSKTIKEHGVRQPLSIIQSDIESGVYEVVSGERRLKAAKIAGLDRVPCQIIQSMDEAEEIALIENIQREDLHPIELGKGYLRLKEKLCFTQEKIASKLGVRRSQVAEYIALSKLPEDVSSLIIEKKITGRDFLREIMKCRGRDKMIELIEFSRQSNSKKQECVLTKKRGPKKQSILRVALESDSFVIQKRKISLLSEKQKKDLKEVLKEIIHGL